MNLPIRKDGRIKLSYLPAKERNRLKEIESQARLERVSPVISRLFSTVCDRIIRYNETVATDFRIRFRASSLFDERKLAMRYASCSHWVLLSISDKWLNISQVFDEDRQSDCPFGPQAGFYLRKGKADSFAFWGGTEGKYYSEDQFVAFVLNWCLVRSSES